MTSPKKIAILGAGAIGSVFGCLLATGGHEVTLVGREKHIDAIRRRGLRMDGLWGEREVQEFNLVTAPDQIKDSLKFNYILTAVKSHSTRSILEEYHQLMEPVEAVVSLQNGLGNLEVIAEYYPADRVVGGRVIFGARLIEPGWVRVTVEADSVAVGWYRDGSISAREEIADTFTSSGIKTRAVEDIHRYIWEKVLYNCALNPLSAILGMSYGELMDCAHTHALIEKVIYEIFNVIEKEGKKISYRSPEEYLKKLFKELIPVTSTHYASMLEDIRNGRQTEIDSLNRYIAVIGKRLRVPLEVNEGLTLIIKSLEGGFELDG